MDSVLALFAIKPPVEGTDHFVVTVIVLLALPLSLMLDAEMAVQIQDYLVD